MKRPFSTQIRTAVNAAVSTLEQLESRQLLANDPLSVGTYKVGTATWLNVTGTINDDTIVVRKSAATSYVITNGTWTVTRTGTFSGVRVLAGAGADSISTTGTLTFVLNANGEAGNDTITGGALNDNLSGGADNDSIVGNAGNDVMAGNDGDDTLIGNAGNDSMLGGNGADSLVGSEGNETMRGEAGADTLVGGAGNDAMLGGADADSLNGSEGNDSLLGEAGADTLVGGLGNDSLLGGTEADSIDGGDGNDTAIGDTGADVIIGGTGNDSLLGGNDADTITGDAGADTLNGGAGDDSADGGAGNDRVMGDIGNDVYIGGADVDMIDYTGRLVSLTLSLDGQANDGESGETDNIPDDFEYVIGGNAADSITGNSSTNYLYGGIGNDTIDAGDGNDKVYGGVGNDSLSGGAGNDTIYGQTENDQLYGDAGEDLLEGGAGNDAYFGGDDRDRLIAIGGGALDSVTGGDGLDSFWVDNNTTEILTDVSSDETTAKAVHKVGAFMKYGTTVISKELTGQKFADPVLPTGVTGKLVNFANNKLFSDAGPSADDIKQGQVGDCWYLATLAAIADTNAETIRQAVTDLGDGTFAVRFYHATTRAEQYVRVDADFSTYSWSTTTPLLVSLGAQSSIWAPVMEKALTWVRGSQLGKYATISGGWMNEAFTRLGMTSTVAWKQYGTLSNASAMVDWIRTQFDAGKAVTVGFSAVSGANLVANHAYTVDRINDNGNGTYTITLRNPWGADANSSTDGVNDGYVTLTPAQLFSNYTGLMAA